MKLSTVQEIELAIGALTPQEVEELLLWLEQYNRPQFTDNHTQADLTANRYKLQRFARPNERQT